MLAEQACIGGRLTVWIVAETALSNKIRLPLRWGESSKRRLVSPHASRRLYRSIAGWRLGSVVVALARKCSCAEQGAGQPLSPLVPIAKAVPH